MSKEFFDWFESIPTKEQLKNELSPELTEEKCVRDFFEKNVENKKTSTILLGYIYNTKPTNNGIITDNK